ncbi:hypothetical protein L9F63_014695, partial [Diploptera punctata]
NGIIWEKQRTKDGSTSNNIRHVEVGELGHSATRIISKTEAGSITRQNPNKNFSRTSGAWLGLACVMITY